LTEKEKCLTYYKTRTGSSQGRHNSPFSMGTHSCLLRAKYVAKWYKYHAYLHVFASLSLSLSRRHSMSSFWVGKSKI